MKVNELKVGKTYKIKYRYSLKSKRNGRYNRTYLESSQEGIGVLRKVGDPLPGAHTFELLNGDTVYALSAHVLSQTDDLAVAVPLLVEPSPELEKLRQLGFDDAKRAQEINTIALFLTGLGVDSHPDEEHTGLTIPYAGLAAFKSVVNTLYKRAVLESV